MNCGHRRTNIEPWRLFLPDVLHDQLDKPDELQILCGLAVRYADPAFPANQLRTPGNPVGENVVLLDS